MGINSVVEGFISMLSTEEEIFAFALVLVLGLAVPELLYRVRVSPVPLLIVAGIAVGPYGFNLIGIHPGIEFLGQLGILFLVFIAGLEVHKSKSKHYKEPMLLAVISGVVCFIGGFLIGRLWGMPLQTSLLLGSIMVSSSVGEIISIVNATRSLKERFGTLIIPSIVIMDAGSLILLAIILKLNESMFNILVFIVLATVFIGASAWLVPKIGRYVFLGSKKRAAEHEMRFIIAFLVVMVLISELIRLPNIVTAFLMGMFLGEVVPGERVFSKIRTLGHGFLIPIFFINIGLTMNIRLLVTEPSNILLTASVIVTLMCMKILGSQIYGKISKMTTTESLAVGVVLWPQLGATLAATAIGRDAGVIPPELFVAVITMAIVTAVSTPFLVPVFAREEKHKRHLKNHIVILGCGRVGSALTDVLIDSSEDFVVIENDLNKVHKLRKKWVDVIYGDATEVKTLAEANVRDAKVVILALPEVEDTVIAAKNVRALNRDCYIIARVHQEKEVCELEGIVDHIIRPEALTALDLVRKTLHILEENR